MGKLIGEMLFGLIESLVAGWLKEAAIKAATWLDSKINGRTSKVALGGILGLAAYFIFPIIMGMILGLLG